MKKYFFFIFILISQVFSYSIIISSPHYYGKKLLIGSEISSVKLIIDSNKDYYTFKYNTGSWTLFKFDDYYIANPNYVLSEKDFDGNAFCFEILELNKKECIEKADLSDKYKLSLKESVNYNQDLMISISSDYKINAHLISPEIEDNFFICKDNNCYLNFKVKEKKDFNLIIKAFIKIDNKELPIYIRKEIKVKNNLNIELINPDANNILYSPFFIKLKVSFDDSTPYVSDYILKMDGKIKAYSIDGNILKISYFMFPFLRFKHSFEISDSYNKASKNYDFIMKPSIWYYLVFSFIILLIILEIAYLLYKRNKKKDLNRLIAEREAIKEKIASLKKKYISGSVTKSYFDSEMDILLSRLSELDSLILALEKSKETEDESLHLIKEKPKKEVHKPIIKKPIIPVKKKKIIKKENKKKESKNIDVSAWLK